MTETKPLYNPPTVVGIFMHQARRFGDKKLSMAKKGGAWETKTWRQALESLPSVVMGLFALGFEKGDTIGIAGRTRVEWSEADMTILADGQSLGDDACCFSQRPADLFCGRRSASG